MYLKYSRVLTQAHLSKFNFVSDTVSWPLLESGQTITYFWGRQRSLPLWMMARQPEPNSFISQLSSADASHHILLTIPWLHHKDELPPSDVSVSIASEGSSVIASHTRGSTSHVLLWLTPFRWFRRSQPLVYLLHGPLHSFLIRGF